MITHEKYMHRCLQLAKLGAGYVAPNPMVGAVLVHNDTIIGEGYHQRFGEAHAEVNCIKSVATADQEKIQESVLYVSLEPCAHFGKTPPCADLIIASRIPAVVIGCRDPFKEVDGKGIEKLQRAGVSVQIGVLEAECRGINRRFFLFHTRHRPYIILKWAETADHRIGFLGTNRLKITNPLTDRVVHRWRAEEQAIMVGTNTAAFDNPMLTTRLWPGPDPVRVVIDYQLRLPPSLNIFNDTSRVIVINTLRHETEGNISYYQVTHDVDLVPQVLNALYHHNIQSVIIEGGARLTQQFIDDNSWDEARIINNQELIAGDGVAAPLLHSGMLESTEAYGTDIIRIFKNNQ